MLLSRSKWTWLRSKMKISLILNNYKYSISTRPTQEVISTFSERKKWALSLCRRAVFTARCRSAFYHGLGQQELHTTVVDKYGTIFERNIYVQLRFSEIARKFHRRPFRYSSSYTVAVYREFQFQLMSEPP